MGTPKLGVVESRLVEALAKQARVPVARVKSAVLEHSKIEDGRFVALVCMSIPLGKLAPKLPKLKRLVVDRCSLSSLDVRGVPDLVSLECPWNTIATLDLSPLTKLSVLWCQGNGADVRLPKSAPLVKIALNKNPLGKFDPGAYPTLATLFVDETGLEELALDNPALGHLDCSNNALATLDLAGAPALRRLSVTGNRLKALDLRPLRKLHELAIDPKVAVKCTELQKHSLPALRERFGLPKATKTIAKMDAFQLHAFTESYNWDDGTKKLFDVIRHPACTLATALHVYWQGEPGELSAYATAKDAPKDEKKTVELLREIEDGVKKKRFAKGPIPFDPHDVDGVDLVTDDPKIPAVMKNAVP